MNTRIISCSWLLMFGAACAPTSTVQVVDARTKRPVPGARVVAVDGRWSSDANYTDADGATPEPTLPAGARHLVVERPGYESQRVRINP